MPKEQWRFTKPDPATLVGAAALRTGSIVAGTDPAEIIPDNETRRSVLVQNLSDNDIYVGGEDVTAATGIRVSAGGSLTLYVTTPVWTVASAPGAEVRYLEES